MIPGLHYRKVWFRYPCCITVIWPKKHYSWADKRIYMLTFVNTYTHVKRPTPVFVSELSKAQTIAKNSLVRHKKGDVTLK